jgi:hypothetical protein
MVESSDRLFLGWVVDPEPADGAHAFRLRTRDRPMTLLVAHELVESVDADGTARLSCTRQELDRLATGAGGQEALARGETIEAGEAHSPRTADPRPLTPDIEYVPLGVVVQHRQPPRQEGDRFIVPIYEEQLVVDKRLVLRAEMRIRAPQPPAFESTPAEASLVADGRQAMPIPPTSPDQPTVRAKPAAERRFITRREEAASGEADQTDEPGSSGLQRLLLRLLK